MLAITVTVEAIAWLAGKLFEVQRETRADAVFWILATALPLTGAWATIASIKWIRPAFAQRGLRLQEIADAQVAEERHRFTAAKRFQEPEHGGLTYFLLGVDGEVLTLYDHESQELGRSGAEPLESAFKPRTGLLLVRAPRTRDVITQSFDGDMLPCTDAGELHLPPGQWPEPDERCDMPWDELEARLGPPAPPVR